MSHCQIPHLHILISKRFMAILLRYLLYLRMFDHHLNTVCPEDLSVLQWSMWLRVLYYFLVLVRKMRFLCSLLCMVYNGLHCQYPELLSWYAKWNKFWRKICAPRNSKLSSCQRICVSRMKTHLNVLHVLRLSYLQLEMTAQKEKNPPFQENLCTCSSAGAGELGVFLDADRWSLTA